METVAQWAGFLGAWLLVAGPLFQGSVELWEIGRKGHGDIQMKPIDSALWLVPPILYIVQLQRIRRYERSSHAAAQHGLSTAFANRATGWFAVAGGAVLIAVKETWELAELYEVSIAVCLTGIAALVLASFVNVAIRMWRIRSEIDGTPAK